MRTFTIKRLTGESRKKSFATTGDMISGFLGTASAEFTAMVDGEFGKTFSFTSDEFDADLRIGDRITDSEDASKEYDVKGVLPQADGPGRMIQAIVVLPID